MLTALSFCCNLSLPILPDPPNTNLGPPNLEGRVTIHEDNRKPSPRQQHVIQLVAKGLKNREIASKLGIGEHVVRNYLSIIYDKVGVSNRVELALWYEARLHERRFRRKR
jgi:DNA-binding NarL/FixJ family response regulator